MPRIEAGPAHRTHWRSTLEEKCLCWCIENESSGLKPDGLPPEIERSVAQYSSDHFTRVRGLPAFKIGTHNEKFPADLNDANAFFLKDPAEMTHRETSKLSGP